LTAPRYVGRFAPSPTGRLHWGSLVTALASALDARHRGGAWRLRIEDLDTPRVVPGATQDILATLERLGFEWQGSVLQQHSRLEVYAEAARSLAARGLLYECSCPRAARGRTEGERGYPGTCRAGGLGPGPTATRFRVDDAAIERFTDRVQGDCTLPLARLGDPVIRRRDRIYAYQLAVVIDDAEQGVTDVVRGADLLESSGWQRALQRALGLPGVGYAHLPVLVEPDGSKLAKSRHSVAIDPTRGSAALVAALRILRQDPPEALKREGLAAVWAWGTRHWSIERLAGLREIRFVPPHSEIPPAE
jgi:glutamyl-Q tRNA(Asp) synthetase